MDFYALSGSSEILLACQDIFVLLVKGRFVRLGLYDVAICSATHLLCSGGRDFVDGLESSLGVDTRWCCRDAP